MQVHYQPDFACHLLLKIERMKNSPLSRGVFRRNSHGGFDPDKSESKTGCVRSWRIPSLRGAKRHGNLIVAIRIDWDCHDLTEQVSQWPRLKSPRESGFILTFNIPSVMRKISLYQPARHRSGGEGCSEGTPMEDLIPINRNQRRGVLVVERNIGTDISIAWNLY